MPRICYIYAIRCLPTGREYVGSTVALRCRWSTHKKFLKRQVHGNPKLQRAWDKYGADQFEFSVLCQCCEDEREHQEDFWIHKKNSHIRGFNLSPVKGESSLYATKGMLGKKHSAESRAKMRAARLGVAPWNKGGKHSEETRKKIGLAQIGHKKHLGKKHSEATREKQRLAKLGKKLSLGHRQKISLANRNRTYAKGKSPSEETRNKLRETQLLYWANKRAGGA